MTTLVKPGHLTADDFDYVLPPDAIAQRPPERRGGARMLLLDRAGSVSEASDAHFEHLHEHVTGDELFVFNDTRVVPARLQVLKETGGRVELLALGPSTADPRQLDAMARSSKPVRAGMKLWLDDARYLEVIKPLGHGHHRLRLPDDIETLWSLLDRYGKLPLPPYISRPTGPDAADRQRYQTVFAEHPGSVAAPTAGLHFTDQLLESIRAKGCETTEVTLHVGPGTFQPVRASQLADHRMHAERYEVSARASARVNEATRSGRPIVAVGTTVVRTLEAVAAERGQLEPCVGQTDIFITPGWRFQLVDALITNFHLPRSTLLMLVSALLGRAKTLEAYKLALERGYRFYSYGDGMWLR